MSCAGPSRSSASSANGLVIDEIEQFILAQLFARQQKQAVSTQTPDVHRFFETGSLRLIHGTDFTLCFERFRIEGGLIASFMRHLNCTKII